MTEKFLIDSNSLITPQNPNKYAKILYVAKAFGVKTNNLYYMMRQLGIKIQAVT